MCGISGSFGGVDRGAVERMTLALAHRGPDGAGVWCDEAAGVALGHRRLAVLDLSAASAQPMASSDGRYHLVYNGEIYNYRELRRELAAAGHAFRSEGDAEVLLAAWAAWGAGCLPRLRGMFAFVLHDGGGGAVDSQLYLARDRYGIKPLYYARRGGTVHFSSELKGLLGSGVVPRVLDPQAVWDYLTLGAVAQPRTILAGVSALPPGHLLTLRTGGAPALTRWWAPSAPLTGAPAVVDLGEAARELRRRLEEAARLHLVADVPVGAFLSGGVDSTAVVALMSAVAGARVRTFSVGFEGASEAADERPWARLAAERLGTEHTEVTISGAAVAEAYDRIVWAIDQPSLDGANTYLVARAARADVTVALTGLGGDELFAGYPHFARFARAARVDRALEALGGSAARGVLRFVPGRWLHDKEYLLRTPLERCAMLRALADEGRKAGMVASALDPAARVPTAKAVYAGLCRPCGDAVADMVACEVDGYLVNTLLRDCDAMGMANSLEIRPLLLDNEVAGYACELPGRFKLHKGAGKLVLRRAVAGLVPAEILAREKRGFEMPLAAWLAGPLRERARAAFTSREAAALFSPAFLAEARAAPRSSGGPPFLTWACLMLVEWVRLHRCELATE